MLKGYRQRTRCILLLHGHASILVKNNDLLLFGNIYDSSYAIYCILIVLVICMILNFTRILNQLKIGA